MDEEIERLMISVRADTGGFARDVAEMRGQIEGSFGSAVERAGQMLETSLSRAIRSGKLGFDDLKSVALSVLSEIAAAAIRAGLNSLSGGGQQGQSGGQGGGLAATLANIAATALTAYLGSPGRATGGPVSPGRPYMVGERGPELFVPTSAGSVVAAGQGGGARDVRVSININSPANTAPDVLARSSRQVARAVRSALLQG